jgi:DNA-binding response OmpR family regulator
MQPEDTPRAASPTVALYGPESGNHALADELLLDGFDVRLVSDPAMLGVVDLIVFAHASDRSAGLGALRALRRGELAGSGVRVLWVSRAENVMDALRAFEAGADDVIRAPFVYAELRARARALLYRAREPQVPAGVVRHGSLEINRASRRVSYDGTPVRLRPLEYLLLVHLAQEPGRVYTKAELLREVWGYEIGSTRTVDTHVSRLRCKLARVGAEGLVVATWGVGYCLAPNSPRLTTGGTP